MAELRQANNANTKTSIEFEEPLEEIAEDRIFKIPLETIVPCPFEPQTRRRALFKPEEIESLASSIEADGLFSPIVVRPSRKFVRTNKQPIYEIVFGERRYLAHRLKNITTIKCFVREISDADVLKMQFKENHERKENHALDDAFTFLYLKQKENYTDEELASRLNVSRREVVERLKLNDLIAEAKEELQSGDLPLKHAYYIARFPAKIQKEICEEKYARFGC